MNFQVFFTFGETPNRKQVIQQKESKHNSLSLIISEKLVINI
jgi:hypothetical protein